MGALRLPEGLRGELSKPYGRLLEKGPEENAREVIAMIRASRPRKVIIVGDFTLSTFSKQGFLPDIGIFDRKTKRSSFSEAFTPTSRISNPQGCISDEAAAAIENALKSKDKSMIFVEGEEDLLSIPSIAMAPVGSLVIYGLPGRGMVVITVDPEMKKKMRELLGRFERI